MSSVEPTPFSSQVDAFVELANAKTTEDIAAAKKTLKELTKTKSSAAAIVALTEAVKALKPKDNATIDVIRLGNALVSTEEPGKYTKSFWPWKGKRNEALAEKMEVLFTAIENCKREMRGDPLLVTKVEGVAQPKIKGQIELSEQIAQLKMFDASPISVNTALIASGSFGRVFKITIKAKEIFSEGIFPQKVFSQKVYALKTQKNINEKTGASFQEEYEILVYLQKYNKHGHFLTPPSFVRVLDSHGEEVSDSIGLLYEYCAGGDLASAVKKRIEVGSPETFRLSIELLEACHLLEQAKIWHNDIKPGNVLLFWDGSEFHIKVGDFGLAKRIPELEKPKEKSDKKGMEFESKTPEIEGLTEDEIKEWVGKYIGMRTPEYLPVEYTIKIQDALKNGKIQEALMWRSRIELFSFGRTIAELITGTDAFPKLGVLRNPDLKKPLYIKALEKLEKDAKLVAKYPNLPEVIPQLTYLLRRIMWVEPAFDDEEEIKPISTKDALDEMRSIYKKLIA